MAVDFEHFRKIQSRNIGNFEIAGVSNKKMSGGVQAFGDVNGSPRVCSFRSEAIDLYAERMINDCHG